MATTKPTVSEVRRAVFNLNGQGVEIQNPLVTLKHINKKGMLISEKEQAFPGYLFVHFDFDVTSSSAIGNTRGVKGLVRFGDKLAVVSDSMMKDVKRVFNLEGVTIDKSIQPGDSVDVKSGPFNGHRGIFQSADGETRSNLFFALLGSTQAVAIENVDLVLPD